MWFVFPQLRGLGRSPTAQRYAIVSAGEASAYLADVELGPRLTECCAALLGLPAGTCAETVLGEVDAAKLHSCATLFAEVDDGSSGFDAILHRYHGGRPDPATERLIAQIG